MCVYISKVLINGQYLLLLLIKHIKIFHLRPGNKNISYYERVLRMHPAWSGMKVWNPSYRTKMPQNLSWIQSSTLGLLI